MNPCSDAYQAFYIAFTISWLLHILALQKALCSPWHRSQNKCAYHLCWWISAPFVVAYLIILHLFAGKRKKKKTAHASCALVSLARFPQNSCAPEKFCQVAKWNAHSMNIYDVLMIGFLHPWIIKILTRTDNEIVQNSGVVNIATSWCRDSIDNSRQCVPPSPFPLLFL